MARHYKIFATIQRLPAGEARHAITDGKCNYFPFRLAIARSAYLIFLKSSAWHLASAAASRYILPAALRLLLSEIIIFKQGQAGTSILIAALGMHINNEGIR